jgi:hypothetical protein
MRRFVALVLAAFSAYALSFALDLLVGNAVGVYPAAAIRAIAPWALLSAVAGVIAVYLAPTFRWLVSPALLIALLAVAGGIIGHRHSLIVGAAMLGQAGLMWRATAPSPASHSPLR